jgi:cell division protein FtsQ
LKKRTPKRNKKRRRRNPASGSKAPRYTKRLLLTVLVLIPIFAGVVVWLAFFTDVCAIERVNVSGNKNLSVEYVKQLSGIATYKNLITLPVKKLATNLKKDLWIRNAKINRRLPDTVNIVLDERSPIAMLDYDGAAFLVDERAFVFAQASAEQMPNLMRIHYGDMPMPKVGQTIKNKKIRESVKIAASMPAGLLAALSMANPFDGRGVVFVCRDGFNIVYGSAEDTEKKNEILQAIRVDVANNGRRIAYINVKVPDSPVIKPK